VREERKDERGRKREEETARGREGEGGRYHWALARAGAAL
jgi:hypothetical protein